MVLHEERCWSRLCLYYMTNCTSRARFHPPLAIHSNIKVVLGALVSGRELGAPTAGAQTITTTWLDFQGRTWYMHVVYLSLSYICTETKTNRLVVINPTGCFHFPFPRILIHILEIMFFGCLFVSYVCIGRRGVCKLISHFQRSTHVKL